MKLSDYDDKCVSLTLEDGNVFEGECIYSDREYNECELGINYEALQIDDCLFCSWQIVDVKIIEPKEHYIWENRLQHEMHLNRKPFGLMEKGKKTIELRLYDEKRREIHKGDIIRFTMSEDEEEILRVIVTDLHVYESFEKLYEELDLHKLGYTDDNIEEASYKDVEEYYTPAQQAQYGVVGIEVTVW